MIRELTLNEMEEVSGGVSTAGYINAGSYVVGSLACPIAVRTGNPYVALVCGISVVANYASFSYIRGATAG